MKHEHSSVFFISCMAGIFSFPVFQPSDVCATVGDLWPSESEMQRIPENAYLELVCSHNDLNVRIAYEYPIHSTVAQKSRIQEKSCDRNSRSAVLIIPETKIKHSGSYSCQINDGGIWVEIQKTIINVVSEGNYSYKHDVKGQLNIKCFNSQCYFSIGDQRNITDPQINNSCDWASEWVHGALTLLALVLFTTIGNFTMMRLDAMIKKRKELRKRKEMQKRKEYLRRNAEMQKQKVCFEAEGDDETPTTLEQKETGDLDTKTMMLTASKQGIESTIRAIIHQS
ncbi:uncharacterized protein LOC135837305 [Planococcus citri]|uniref:uncharacterized protein LOC135837305 n=1 Tax=Planococcus citri TaxID=170843 RepID=UPI0031F86761